MEKNKITFEQVCDPAFRRQWQMQIKSEAVWVTFLELRGLINISEFAKQYFERTHAWFSQKLNMNRVNGRRREFTPEEYDRIATSLRDIARRLNEAADAIDAAHIPDDNDNQ